MDFLEIKAGKNDSDRRLDKILRIYFPEIPLSEIFKLIRKNLIKINGKKTKAEYKVQENDLISYPKFITENHQEINEKDVNISSKEQNQRNLPSLPPVVFENDHLLILDKPYDMLVHGSNNSLDRIVESYYLNNFKQDSLSFKPGPLHRIDKKTTGLIAFSLSLKGAQWFTENIKNHCIKKTYYGLVQGKIESQEIWRDFIKKEDNNDKGFCKVKASSVQVDDGKEAVTIVTPIESGKYKETVVTFVEFNIKTGRTHQIRAQSALHNHVLLGDTAYGGKRYKELKQEFFLQAFRLEFPKNDLNLPKTIEILPSEEFCKILNLSGIQIKK